MLFKALLDLPRHQAS